MLSTSSAVSVAILEALERCDPGGTVATVSFLKDLVRTTRAAAALVAEDTA
jgi:hypothetical protein